MSKVKYYYDSDTLSYRKITRKKRRTFKYVLAFLFSSALLAFFFVFLGSQFFESPNEKALKRELSNMQLQFDLLNKKMTEAETVLANVEDRDNNIYRLYFESNPIPEEQRKAGFGGVNRYKGFEGFDNSKLIKESNKRIDILQKRIVVQSKSLDEIAVLAEEKENLLASIPAIQPVNNEDLTRMASGYGMRTDPFNKTRKMHFGMDFTAPRGTPIYAAGDGVVDRADSNSAGYGKHIRIDHGYGYISLYAHLYKYHMRIRKQIHNNICKTNIHKIIRKRNHNKIVKRKKRGSQKRFTTKSRKEFAKKYSQYISYIIYIRIQDDMHN